MTAVAVVTATFQAVIVVWLWRRSKRIGGGHLAAMFATAWFLFSDVARLTLVLTPGRWRSPVMDVYQSVTVDSLDRWMLWSTVLLCAFAVGTTIARRRGPEAPSVTPPTSLRPVTARRCAVALIPLFPALLFRSSSFVSGLAVQYTMLLISLAVIDLSLRRPKRTLLYVAAGCGLMTLFGQRLEVVTVAVLSLGTVVWLGGKIDRRRLVRAALVVAVVLVAISGGRQTADRQVLTESRTADRLAALYDGLGVGFTGRSLKAQFEDVTERIDANAFGAVVLETQRHNDTRIGWATVRNSLLLSIPSFLYNSKIERPLWDRNEKAYIVHTYDLPIRQDFIPGWGPTVVSWWGPTIAVGVFGMIGFSVGALDRWLRRRTLARLLVGLHVALGACLFERGPEGLILILRGAVPLLVVYGYLRILRLGAAAHARTRSPLSHYDDKAAAAVPTGA